MSLEDGSFACLCVNFNLMVAPSHIHFRKYFRLLEIVPDLLRCLHVEFGSLHSVIQGRVIDVHPDAAILFVSNDNIHHTIIVVLGIHVFNHILLSKKVQQFAHFRLIVDWYIPESWLLWLEIRLIFKMNWLTIYFPNLLIINRDLIY